ncbi:LINE-1 reverse transcriptase [Plakobranchus ocellatus]|uniref:LINE-1 reverse transcriptase n=1 Tax=Plakobranchus ocellatus TaxID=259542 RepID=A0AAV3ZXC3_9GAST|nr:LINE-1 reverse transcriptase [Plakobranchus ocellatus]
MVGWKSNPYRGVSANLSAAMKLLGLQRSLQQQRCHLKCLLNLIESARFTKHKACLHVKVTWVAGNTLVLKFGQRAGKAPFQIDAPRLVDAKKFRCKKGCFQASLDKKGQLMLEPNENCLEKLPYICGYDPLDYKFIEKEMTHDEAVVECNKLKRPLASLRTLDQVNKARKVVQWRKKHVWISAKYDKDNRAYKWEDGSYLSYHNWAHTVPQAFDKVKHAELFSMLEKLDIDGKDLRVIRNLYWDQTTSVRIEKVHNDFKSIKRGVRQGCVLSPDRFNLYSEIILRNIDDTSG